MSEFINFLIIHKNSVKAILISVITLIIVSIILFISGQIKKIPKILKWFSGFYKKQRQNYKNNSVTKSFNPNLNKIATIFLKFYEQENDRCDTIIVWIKKEIDNCDLKIDFYYKDEIKNWINDIKKIAANNDLKYFQENAPKFSTIIYNYNYYFCKDIYDKLYNCINKITKDDWNKVKTSGIDLVSPFLLSNSDINKLKDEWNRRVDIYNPILKNWNNLIKQINKENENKKIGYKYTEINNDEFIKKLQ
jgi:hypothetical protein